MTEEYPRDLIGYNGQPPKVEWPNNASIAKSSKNSMKSQIKALSRSSQLLASFCPPVRSH